MTSIKSARYRHPFLGTAFFSSCGSAQTVPAGPGRVRFSWGGPLLLPAERTPASLKLCWEAGGWEVLWTIFTVLSLRPGLDFPLGDSGREPQDWVGLFNEVATQAVSPANFSSRLTFFSDDRNTQEGFLSPWQARVGVAGALPLAQTLVITGTPLGSEPTPLQQGRATVLAASCPEQGSLWEMPPDLSRKGQGFLKRQVIPDSALLILALSGACQVFRLQ